MSYKNCYGRKEGQKISRCLNLMLKMFARMKKTKHLQLNKCEDLIRRVQEINKAKPWQKSIENDQITILEYDLKEQFNNIRKDNELNRRIYEDV